MNPTDPTLFVLKKIVMYLFLVVVFFGILGNLAAIKTFSRNRFKNTVFSTYFRFMTVTDSISLLFYTLFKYLQWEIDFNIRVLSGHLCQLFLIIAYAIPATSSWIIAFISLDRLLSVKLNTKFLFRKEKLFQIAVCFGVLSFNLVIYLQLYFSYIEETPVIDRFGNKTNKTNLKCKRVEVDLLGWLNLLNADVLPFLTMTISTVFILRVLVESRKKMKQKENEKYAVKRSSQKKLVKNNRDQKFAISSISLNLIFLVTNLPVCIYELIDAYTIIDPEIEVVVYRFTEVVYSVNFGSMFFINFVANSMFRNEFLKLFYFSHRHQNASSIINTSKFGQSNKSKRIQFSTTVNEDSLQTTPA
jgi:hypothetical protein